MNAGQIKEMEKKSLIRYIQQQLGIENLSDVRDAPNMQALLELVLSDEVKSRFAAEQYWFLANLLRGKARAFGDYDQVMRYLKALQDGCENG